MTNTQPTGLTPAEQALRGRLERLAGLLDNAFRVPGTRIRFGLDPIIGLVPGIGDLIGLIVGLWVIWQARGIRVPKLMIVRMLGNLLIEAILGIVPFVGDAFDLMWQSNERNRALLIGYLDAKQAASTTTRRQRRWLWLLGLLALIMLLWAGFAGGV